MKKINDLDGPAFPPKKSTGTPLYQTINKHKTKVISGLVIAVYVLP